LEEVAVAGFDSIFAKTFDSIFEVEINSKAGSTDSVSGITTLFGST